MYCPPKFGILYLYFLKFSGVLERRTFFLIKDMKGLKVFHVILLSIFITYSSCFGALVVHFIDIGEGDCILIQMPDNKNILVDTGNLSVGYKVEKYLKSKNISKLDCIIITHMHPDHVGGIFNILPQYKTNILYFNGYCPQDNEFFFELINLAKYLNIPMKTLNAENKLSFGKVTLNVLSPIIPLSGEMNEDSIVLKIIFGKTSFLLTGDLNINGEKRLMKAGFNLKSDVLKVGHHGAKDASSEEFLDMIRPKIAVLSVGKKNRYGYPSNVIIERFKIKEIPLYRTDLDGTIIIQTDGDIISIKKERQ